LRGKKKEALVLAVKKAGKEERRGEKKKRKGKGKKNKLFVF
jgi:hypothetical protein